MMAPPLRLGVNIDHVATVRNARGGIHPDPVRAANMAVLAGADAVINLNGASPQVGATAPMANGRRQHNLTVLADGTVLATGGNSSGASLTSQPLASARILASCPRVVAA